MKQSLGRAALIAILPLVFVFGDRYTPWLAESTVATTRESGMMRRTLTTLFLVPLALTITGCGTVFNFYDPGGPKQIYGGVLMDCGFAADCLKRDAPPLLIDVPLSIIGDTLTLPITIPCAIERTVERCQEKKERQTRKNTPADAAYNLPAQNRSKRTCRCYFSAR